MSNKEAYVRVALSELADSICQLTQGQPNVGLAAEIAEQAVKHLRQIDSEVPPGTKAHPTDLDTFYKALPDEPIFTLLGRDPSAPILVERWAQECVLAINLGERPETDEARVDSAMARARQMRDWRQARYGAWLNRKEE